MKKIVLGIGGVFFKTKDSEKLMKWYSQHLGISSDQYGSTFEWKRMDGRPGYTVWSPFKQETNYFEPSKKEMMINYIVDDLESLMAELKKEGVTIAGEIQSFDYGKFGWIMDPEGNKIELWEPVDKNFAELVEGKTIS